MKIDILTDIWCSEEKSVKRIQTQQLKTNTGQNNNLKTDLNFQTKRIKKEKNTENTEKPEKQKTILIWNPFREVRSSFVPTRSSLFLFNHRTLIVIVWNSLSGFFSSAWIWAHHASSPFPKTFHHHFYVEKYHQHINIWDELR